MTDLGSSAYELIRRLGQGGGGEVFLAKQVSFGNVVRQVVVKRIPPLAGRNTDKEDLLREARIIAQLNHPNVVQIYDVVTIGGEIFIAMELVHGVDLARLAELARAEGTEQLPLAVSLAIASQIAAGLDHVHRATDPEGHALGLVHRDVTPSNILLGFDGRAKLADFGIAKATLQNTDLRTQTGLVKGKVAYLSPEQVIGKPVDARSDIFTFGVMFAELLTGHHPFRASNDFAIMRRIVLCDLGEWLNAAQDVPEELREICVEALSLAPDRRTNSAQELGRALAHAMDFLQVRQPERVLSEFLGQFRTGLEKEQAQTKTLQVSAKVPRGMRLATPGAVVLGLAILLGATFFYWPRPELAPVAASAAAATLVINSQPDSAEVLIDGVLRTGQTPLIVSDLPAGKTVTVELRKPRYLPQRQLAYLDASVRTMDFSLSAERPGVRTAIIKPAVAEAPLPLPPPSSHRPGFIKFKVQPYASIFLDGAFLGDLPMRDRELPPGEHRIEIVNKDYGFDKTISVKVSPEQTTVVTETIVRR
jgi:serine/threonine-protein kinase